MCLFLSVSPVGVFLYPSQLLNMSWEGHITNFITGKEAQVSDGAIVCYTEGAESVYAGTEGLKKITVRAH